MNIPDPEPEWLPAAGGAAWMILIVVAIIVAVSLASFFYVRWDRNERAKARLKWEKENPDKSWDALSKKKRSR